MWKHTRLRKIKEIVKNSVVVWQNLYKFVQDMWTHPIDTKACRVSYKGLEKYDRAFDSVKNSKWSTRRSEGNSWVLATSDAWLGTAKKVVFLRTSSAPIRSETGEEGFLSHSESTEKRFFCKRWAIRRDLFLSDN